MKEIQKKGSDQLFDFSRRWLSYDVAHILFCNETLSGEIAFDLGLQSIVNELLISSLLF